MKIKVHKILFKTEVIRFWKNVVYFWKITEFRRKSECWSQQGKGLPGDKGYLFWKVLGQGFLILCFIDITCLYEVLWRGTIRPPQGWRTPKHPGLIVLTGTSLNTKIHWVGLFLQLPCRLQSLGGNCITIFDFKQNVLSVLSFSKTISFILQEMLETVSWKLLTAYLEKQRENMQGMKS